MYPPLPADTTTVDIRLAKFPTIKNLTVTRGR